MLNSAYDDLTFNVDIPDALTLPDINARTQPVANQNGSNGFNVNDALNGVLGLLDNGFAIFQSVGNKIGIVKDQIKPSKPAVTVSADNPSVVFGLNTQQLLLIAGGLAAIIIVPRLLRK